jgi:hypothetical protein
MSRRGIDVTGEAGKHPGQQGHDEADKASARVTLIVTDKRWPKRRVGRAYSILDCQGMGASFRGANDWPAERETICM